MVLEITKQVMEITTLIKYTIFYQLLKSKDSIAENLYQAKNEYGKGAVLYGLFLAPQYKYCIVLDENGILSQKQLSKDMIKLLWD